MATAMTLNQCPTCGKIEPQTTCVGCQKSFCDEHIREHRQQLSLKFDNEIVKPHEKIFQDINNGQKSNDIRADVFSQIDQWEETTVQNVHKSAEQVRHQADQLFTHGKDNLTAQFETLTQEIRNRQENNNFNENHIERLGQRINQLQSLLKQCNELNSKVVVVEHNQIDWNRLIAIEKQQSLLQIPPDAKWARNASTIAGNHGKGSAPNQLSGPRGLYVDDDKTVFIADYENNRIVEWKYGATSGEVVVRGNDPENQTDQLDHPTDVLVDKQSDSLIICDYRKRRVVQWPRRSGASRKTIIDNIDCNRITMDHQGNLYVSDCHNHVVKRYRVGEANGTVVAGGHGNGNADNQLDYPTYIFVDRDLSVYVSDNNNHRVMKWVKDAEKGSIVAGGQQNGNDRSQLSRPQGIVVDSSGTVYVAEGGNHRITRWVNGVAQNNVIAGRNGQGNQADQLFRPEGLSFDQNGNLYVVDFKNERVQRFDIEAS